MNGKLEANKHHTLDFSTFGLQVTPAAAAAPSCSSSVCSFVSRLPRSAEAFGMDFCVSFCQLLSSRPRQ